MVGSSKPPLCPRCGSVMSWHRAAGGSPFPGHCDDCGYPACRDRKHLIAFLYSEHIVAVPPAAQALVVALTQAYCDTDGAVEVFPERRPDGSSTLGIRPSNHYGQLVIAFAAEGHITDVTWEAA